MQSSQEIIQNKKTLLEANRIKDLKANSSNRTNRSLIKNKQTKAENFSTEAKATMIMQTLKADTNWLRWYCKVVNTLSESTIQNILDGARKASRPDCYFAKAAKIEMSKLNG